MFNAQLMKEIEVHYYCLDGTFKKIKVPVLKIDGCFALTVSPADIEMRVSSTAWSYSVTEVKSGLPVLKGSLLNCVEFMAELSHQRLTTDFERNRDKVGELVKQFKDEIGQ